jgi:hypothetical protein
VNFVDPFGLATYIILYGDPGLGEHNVGRLFEMAADTRLNELAKIIKPEDNIIVRHVSTVSDIKRALRHKDIVSLEYYGHGSWNQLYPGEDPYPGTNLDIPDVENLPGTFLINGSIILYSCFSASGDEQSIAGAFAKRYKVPVTGSKTGMTFKGIKKKPTKMVGTMNTVDIAKLKRKIIEAITKEIFRLLNFWANPSENEN